MSIPVRSVSDTTPTSFSRPSPPPRPPNQRSNSKAPSRSSRLSFFGRARSRLSSNTTPSSDQTRLTPTPNPTSGNIPVPRGSGPQAVALPGASHARLDSPHSGYSSSSRARLPIPSQFMTATSARAATFQDSRSVSEGWHNDDNVFGPQLQINELLALNKVRKLTNHSRLRTAISFVADVPSYCCHFSPDRPSTSDGDSTHQRAEEEWYCLALAELNHTFRLRRMQSRDASKPYHEETGTRTWILTEPAEGQDSVGGF